MTDEFDRQAALAGGMRGRPGSHWVMTLAGITLIGFLLYVGKPLLLPLALAVLLSFLLTPLCEWLEHHKVPRVVATVAVVTLAAGIVVAIGFAIYSGLARIGDSWPAYTQRLVNKAEHLSFGGQGGEGEGESQGNEASDGAVKLIGGVGETIEKVTEAATGEDSEEDEAATQPAATQPAATETQDNAAADFAAAARRLNRNFTERESAVVAAIGAATDRFEAALEAFRRELTEEPFDVVQTPREQTNLERAGYYLALAAGPLGQAGLVAIFVLFILLQRDDLRDRVIKLTAGTRINLATQALDDASRRISRYLRAQAFINGTYGLTIGLGLLAISYLVAGSWFPGVILWAILCAVLRFIPYLGPWLAAAFPLLVSLGNYEGYTMFVAVAGLFIVVELISNNVMEPMLYGSSVGMSEFAVIIAVTVWTFLWGPVGLIVATPLTTCLVVLGKHVPALGFIDTLLGNEPVLSPHSRLYQRLLAMDADDAGEEVDAYRQEHTLTETFDELLLPTLALSERDRESGNLTPERSEFIRTTMNELVEELSDQEEPLPSDSVDINDPQPLASAEAPLRQARIVLLPASDEADHTAAQMLKTLLDRRGFAVHVVNEDQLASEKLQTVVTEQADVVLVSALPPRAVGRARYLVKRLGACGVQTDESMAVLVGLWTTKGDPARAAARVCGKRDLKGPNPVRIVTTLGAAADAIRQRAEVVTAKRGVPLDSRPGSATVATTSR